MGDYGVGVWSETAFGLREKIAAFGSSYRGSHSKVGAAEGCDLLIWRFIR